MDAGIESIGEVLNIKVELRVPPSTEEDQLVGPSISPSIV